MAVSPVRCALLGGLILDKTCWKTLAKDVITLGRCLSGLRSGEGEGEVMVTGRLNWVQGGSALPWWLVTSFSQ